MTILLIKTGTTVANVRSKRGDFEVWFAAAMGLGQGTLRIVSVYEGEALPESFEVSGVVLTGSAAMVSDRLPWSEAVTAWLRQAVGKGTPILGVCYGHQLLAHALGGRVAKNPRGRQIGTVDVTLTEAGRADRLFQDLPSVLHVPASHVESVVEPPPGARILATAERDPYHAFAIGDHVWGVQFHPEFDAQIVRGYIEARWDDIANEGLDPDLLYNRAIDSPDGTILLRRFARIAGGEA